MNFFVAWLQCDCNYRDEIQKRIALHEFQSSEALGDFWSFTCISKSILCTQSGLTKSEGEILNWDAIANPKRAIQVQAMFSAKKKTLTGDTDDQKFNCDNADGHSKAGNWKKQLSPSWIQKTSRKNKSNEKRLETLFTHSRSKIYLHKLPFIVDLTDIKSWIGFEFS